MTRFHSNASARVCETQLDGSPSAMGGLACVLWGLARSALRNATELVKGRSEVEPAEFRRTSEGDYLKESLELCEEILENLIQAGLVERGDVLHFGPVSSCFRRWPPRIRVSFSEVLSILIEESTVARWRASACLESKLAKIGERVQRSSSSRSTINNFRTYVLFYIADGEISPTGEHQNRLLGVNFHETLPIDRVEQEAEERRDLISRLCYLYGRETLRTACTAAHGDLRELNVVLQSVPFRESSRFVYSNSAKDVVIGTGVLSILGLICALGGLLLLAVARETQAVLALIGLLSALGMIAAGEGADLVLAADAAQADELRSKERSRMAGNGARD